MSDDQAQELLKLTRLLLAEYQVLSDLVFESAGHMEVIDRIAQRLRAIKEIEEKLRPLREHSLEASETRSDIRSANDTIVSLIEAIVPRLNELEQQALNSAKNLLPQVKQNIVAMQMKDAYQAGSRS